MSLPLQDPLFWARYTFAYDGEPGFDRLGELAGRFEYQDLDDDDEDIEGVEVAFDVGGGYQLVLDVALELPHHELGLLGPGRSEPAELGWDDLAHWTPHVFRWDELAVICAAVDGERHPGAALALLCRFAAIFDDDDVDTAVATVDAAYLSLRPAGWAGYWPTGADWLARADLRGQNVVWYSNDAGHRWARQIGDHTADLYSTRHSPDGFPHEELRGLLAAAVTPG